MNRMTGIQQVAAWLCGVGLLCLLLGYRGLCYLPMTPEEEKQEQVLQEFVRPGVSRMASDAPVEIREQVQGSLRDASVYARRVPPYEREGTVALAVGLSVLLGGLVLWFRNTTRSQRGRWVLHNEDV